MNTSSPARYNLIAIVLHWLIAAMLIGLVFYGWYMEDLRELMQENGSVPLSDVQAAYNTHKTVGILVLVLSLARLGWRFANPVPPMPSGMKPWEASLARITHIAFYVIMIGIPIGGWMVASSTPFPTLLFNNPDAVLPKLPVPQTESFHETMGSLHGAGGWVILILTALHVLAALKHQFLDRDGLLSRMLPFLKA